MTPLDDWSIFAILVVALVVIGMVLFFKLK